MNIPENIFKSYDIRGIYPQGINEENIIPIIKAIYVLIQKEKNTTESITIVVGRDMRLSSPSLFTIAIKTLLQLGATIIDAGVVSTPTLYFTVFHYGYDGGFQITASHNPKEYNGIKIVRNTTNGLVKIGKSTGMDEIKRMTIEGINPSSSIKFGTITQKNNIMKDEVKNAFIIANNPIILPFKIVADAANAMGATYIDELFRNIPGNLVRMNFELDGNFPVHPADPLQLDTLIDLQKKVIEEKADFGLAPDGDGDRLFFIDEKGQIVQPSHITALVARELLNKNPNQKILYDIRYIITPKKIIEESGGKSVVTKVGHAFITEKMHEVGGIFAGESSAHYFFKATGNAEAQLPIILIVLKIMSETGKKLSEIISSLSRSFESGEFNFKVNNASEIILALSEKYKDGEISNLDGIAITYPEWRFSVRTSNTEPLLRLNVESENKNITSEKKNELTGFIENIAEKYKIIKSNS